MSYSGDIAVGATAYGSFNTRDTDGAPITLAGTPAISIYKNMDDTQDVSGVTLAVDDDSLTGFHRWSVDTSQDGTFFAAGNDFFVVLTAGTVDSVSVVGVVVGHFSIANRPVQSIGAGVITAAAIANGAIDAATFAADVDAEILSYIVDDATRIDASALNTASVTSIPAILVDTGTTLDGKIDTIDSNVDSVLEDTGTTLPATLSTISSFLDTEVAAILADTNELQTDWANGGRLDLILDARASQTSVDDLPTNAELTTALASADDAVLAAVAALNDFDPAADEVLANVKKINDVTLTGDGSATPWGPA